MPGLKGYTFYDEELTGARQVLFNSFIRVPVFLEKNYTLAHLNIQNMLKY